MRTILLACATLLLAAAARADVRLTFYMSPRGDDGASGLSAARPLRSFEKAFSVMQAGDELVLLDGDYGEAFGTGYISYAGLRSGQPPCGRPDMPTVVRAQHPGSVRIVGGLFLGRSFRSDHDIVVQGIDFESLADGTGGSAGALYNASRVTLKDCGFHGVSPMASAILRLDDLPGQDNVLQDVWVWGKAPSGVGIDSQTGLSARRLLIRLEGSGRPLAASGAPPALADALALEGDGARWLSSSTSLGPWPDEDLVRQDLCVDAGVSRGLCAWDSLPKFLRAVQAPPIPAAAWLRPLPLAR